MDSWFWALIWPKVYFLWKISVSYWVRVGFGLVKGLWIGPESRSRGKRPKCSISIYRSRSLIEIWFLSKTYLGHKLLLKYSLEVNLKELVVVLSSFYSFIVFTRLFSIILSLCRFGFVLAWNDFKFENKTYYMIINHIMVLNIDYNPKSVIFLNLGETRYYVKVQELLVQLCALKGQIQFSWPL